MKNRIIKRVTTEYLTGSDFGFDSDFGIEDDKI